MGKGLLEWNVAESWNLQISSAVITMHVATIF